MQVFRARLAKAGDTADKELLDVVQPGTLSSALAHVELARHNARKDAGAAEKAVEGWDEAVRPFGYIGVVQGMSGKE